jgi:hypothetical protein
VTHKKKPGTANQFIAKACQRANLYQAHLGEEIAGRIVHHANTRAAVGVLISLSRT